MMTVIIIQNNNDNCPPWHKIKLNNNKNINKKMKKDEQ